MMLRRYLSALILSSALASGLAFAHEDGGMSESEEGHHHDWAQHGHHHHAWAQHGHHHHGGWMQKLKLSEEQKTALKAMHADSRNQFKDLRKNLWSAKRALLDATLKSKSSAETLQDLAGKVGGASAALAVFHAQEMQKTLALLTPEQRQKLNEMRQHHHHPKGE